MTTIAPPPMAAAAPTVADLIEQLDGVPPHRIWLRPTPGTATDQDVLEARARTGRLCELVDGTLVEKPMGLPESLIAMVVVHLLGNFIRPAKLGVVAGPDATLKLLPGLVRLPDVAFIARARLAGRDLAGEQVPHLAPNLAVEILSPSNTPAEMRRKRKEYFDAGVELLWIIDPRSRQVSVYTAPEEVLVLGEVAVLDGGAVLPGFAVPVAELFADLDEDWGVSH